MSSRRPALLLAFCLVGACEFPAYEVERMLPMDQGQAGAEAAPDPCMTDPCQHGGRCVPLDESFVCLCGPGFRGDRCELDFGDCDPDPCQNGSTCVAGGDSSFCACPEGWEGATCQLSVNDCALGPCQNGGVCVDGFQSFTCKCQPGFSGETCDAALPPTCSSILENDPAATSGVYLVDPDGPGQGMLPLEVLCDMTAMEGGWTMVGQERKGDTGTFKFLGVSVGDPSRAARNGDSALMGERFAGLYDEMRIGWASDTLGDAAAYFRVNEEVFSNTVRRSMPISGFQTTDATLMGWVLAADGAVFCRASASPDERPGDTSWALKPKTEEEGACGCSGGGWSGRGAFYGGHPDATYCNPHDGAWSAVTDSGEAKGDVAGWGLQFWIR